MGLTYASCESPEGSSFQSKIEEDHASKTFLKATVIELGQDFYKPYRLYYNNQHLFISDLAASIDQLTIIDCVNNSLVGKFIDKGKGPHELTSISSVHIVKNKLYLFDAQTQIQGIAVIDSLLINGDVSLRTRKIKRNSSDMLLTMLPLNDSSWISSALSVSADRFNLLRNDSVVQKFGQYPPLERKAELSDFQFYAGVAGLLFSCDLGLDSARNRLIVANKKVDLLEFYDLNSFQLLKRVVGPYGNYSPTEYMLSPNGNGLPCQDCYQGFGSIRITDSTIFVSLRTQKYHTPDSFVTNKIYKLDKEGRLLEILYLDRSISDFVIVPEKQMIFAIDPFANEPLLSYSYQF